MESAPQTLFDTTDPSRYQASRRVTFISMFINVLLSVGQILLGIVGHSQALVADGFHTLADLITDIMVLFALKHSAKAADEDHPYGHARIETAVTVLLGVILLMVSIGIATRASLRLSDAEALLTPSPLTLWLAAITIFTKEGLYRYTLHTAQRFGSELLRANAWHHRSDAISSIIVFIGIGGSILGFNYMDGLAAIGVALFIAKIGFDLAWQSFRELVDTGLEPAQLKHIRTAILGIHGVKTLHLLRTRQTGGQALVDVHIIVDKTISVSEGHHISEVVRTKLIQGIDIISDVMVHIDTEDDVADNPSDALPLRDEILARLEKYFQSINQAKFIEKVNLHYIRGQLRIELVLPFSCVSDISHAQGLAKQFSDAARLDKVIRDITVYFH